MAKANKNVGMCKLEYRVRQMPTQKVRRRLRKWQVKSQRKRKAQAGEAGVLRTNAERKRRLGKTVKQKLKQEEGRRLENTMWLKPTRA